MKGIAIQQGTWNPSSKQNEKGKRDARWPDRRAPITVKRHDPLPLNTLDKALEFAGALSRELDGEKAWRTYRVFASLTGDQFEALIAFLIWKARGESLKKLLKEN